jgi:hypothetical protein
MPSPVLPKGTIVKANWIDCPWQDGFCSRPGVYLLRAASNSAYGNYDGGFPSEADAIKFSEDNRLGIEWKVHRIH